MYEFRWEWLAGDEHKRRFIGPTREDVLGQVGDFLRNSMGVKQPTQTIMRMVAKLTRETAETELPTAWTLRSPLARTVRQS